MKLEKEEYELLYKKLEYRFKNSGNELVNKIKNQEDLSEEDIKLLLKKLEYTFRKSNNEIITKLSDIIGEESFSPVSYSSLSAKKKRDIREKEKIEAKKLKHLESFNSFNGFINERFGKNTIITGLLSILSLLPNKSFALIGYEHRLYHRTHNSMCDPMNTKTCEYYTYDDLKKIINMINNDLQSLDTNDKNFLELKNNFVIIVNKINRTSANSTDIDNNLLELKNEYNKSLLILDNIKNSDIDTFKNDTIDNINIIELNNKYEYFYNELNNIKREKDIKSINENRLIPLYIVLFFILVGIFIYYKERL